MDEDQLKDHYEHCPVCGVHVGNSTYGMILHLATSHFEDGKTGLFGLRHKKCWCGHEISVGGEQYVISDVRNHMAGRYAPGIETPALSLEEIHFHYIKHVLGIRTKEES